MCGSGPFAVPMPFMGRVNAPVVIKDERDYFGALNNPNSASIRCSASNSSLYNITMSNYRTSRCGIYATGNLGISYCSILATDHCIYSEGSLLSVAFSTTGSAGRSNVVGACGIYMVGSYSTYLYVYGSSLSSYSSLYFDVSGISQYSDERLVISDSQLNGEGQGEGSGNVTIKGSSYSTITGCLISGSTTVGRETSIYLDSETSNCFISGNTFTGPISDNGTNNYTQNNLVINL